MVANKHNEHFVTTNTAKTLTDVAVSLLAAAATYMKRLMSEPDSSARNLWKSEFKNCISVKPKTENQQIRQQIHTGLNRGLSDKIAFVPLQQITRKDKRTARCPLIMTPFAHLWMNCSFMRPRQKCDKWLRPVCEVSGSLRFHGVTFEALQACCPGFQRLHPLRTQAASCRLKITLYTFKLKWEKKKKY